VFDSQITQSSLFGDADVDLDRHFETLRHVDLGEGAWIDYAPMWLSGDESLFQCLVETAEWSQPVVKMYDREVITPRLTARVDPSTHQAIPRIIDVLSDRYDMPLDQVSAGWYRDGRDSVAPHGDRIARDLPHALVATISLGGSRRFTIRSKSGGGSRALSLGHGDLVVMGGSTQRTHEHGIPKTTSPVEPRIALMFRHRYD
jgi:alkylated DNA repair dioxygenase AlkB